MLYDILDVIQRDIYQRLLADPFLAEVPIVLASDGDVENDWANAVLLTNPRPDKNKIGLAILVNAISIEPSGDNTDNPSLEIEPTITIIESARINNSSEGTKITASQALMRCMRLFDGLYTKGITQAEWELDTQSIRPFTGRIKNARDVQSAEELNGYECPFKTFTYNEPTTKLPVPILAQDGSAPPQVPDPQVPIFPGELQVTSVALDHPDFTTADIWLTYDGSYPGPANPAAFLSTDLPDDGQLPAAGTPIRAAQYADGFDPSNTTILITV